MPQKENSRKTKGTFGAQRFSVAAKYIFPNPRRSMIVIGLTASVAILAYLVVDFYYLKTSITSSGPLSSFHAAFEKDCASCHTQFQNTDNDKCSTCHEKTGDTLGVYSFAAHEIYRSGDMSRVDSTVHRLSCSECHGEHQGRQAAITEVADTHCVRCHNHAPFENKHPQFDFAAQHAPDDSTLRFPHLRHVKEVMKRQKLVDVERACLYCHHPQPDGRRFEAIAFAGNCEACHLTPGQQTPPLRVRSDDDPAAPGVETLESIRRKRGPGLAWAFQTNPNEFALKPGNRLVKSRIYHQDPWIMENLKMARHTLYPDPGLEDLMMSTGVFDAQNGASKTTVRYGDVIKSLQDYSRALRGRPEPEIQNELARIDSLLRTTAGRLRARQGAALSWRPARPKVNPALSSQQVDELNLFVGDLTKPCQQCHLVANASIVRVQKDQQVLNRAEFDHRAHIIDRRCLDCHTEIPMTPAIADSVSRQPIADRSAIQNLPKIENCAECHNAAKSSNRCVTCHYFHPNKTNRSSLLLYLD